jgi:hypothetical protein
LTFNQLNPIYTQKMSIVVPRVAPCAEPKDINAERKPVLADRYKTRMCRNYEETGKCPYEVKCMFAHGERELRTSEMNMEDGLTTEEAIRKFQREMILKRRMEIEAEEAAKRAAEYAAMPPYPHSYYYNPYGYSTPAYNYSTHQPYSYGSYHTGAYGYEQCSCPDCMNAYQAPPPACTTECTCESCLAAQQQNVAPQPGKYVYEGESAEIEAP